MKQVKVIEKNKILELLDKELRIENISVFTCSYFWFNN